MLWKIEKSHLTVACQHRYSHLSLGGIRRTCYKKLVEVAVGQFCFIQDEHLEKRKTARGNKLFISQYYMECYRFNVHIY